MKWLFRIACIVALLVAPGAARALTLDEGACPQLAEFDSLGNSIATLITLVWGPQWGTWPEFDVEYVDGVDMGDGVYDSWQMALLAAVLCADPWVVDPFQDLDLIRQQYADNVAAAQTLAADIASLEPTLPQAGQLMWDIGEGLLAEFPAPILYGTIVDIPNPGDRLIDLAWWMRRVGDDIIVLSAYGFDIFAAAFGIYTPWTAGMAGLNGGMRTEVLSSLIDPMTAFEAVIAGAQLFEDLANTYSGAITAQLEQDLRDLAALLPQISYTIPNIVVFGDGTGDGAMGAATDWNGDGLSNLTVFNLIQFYGGTREDFVLGVTREAPVFDPQPTSLKRYFHEDAQFTARITDPVPPVTYQWDFEAAKAPIPGGTDDTFDILNVSVLDAGNYFCTITDALGVYVSDLVALEVAAHLNITVHPEGGDVEYLGEHTFDVATAGGFQPLMFQWFKDDAPILNATDASYTTSMLTPADSGAYYVEISDDHTDVVVSRDAVIIVDDGMPVAAGALVLSLIAGALAVGGAGALRRKP